MHRTPPPAGVYPSEKWVSHGSARETAVFLAGRLVGIVLLLGIELSDALADGGRPRDASGQRVAPAAHRRRGLPDHAALGARHLGPALAQRGERVVGAVERVARRPGGALLQRRLGGGDLDAGVGGELQQRVHRRQATRARYASAGSPNSVRNSFVSCRPGNGSSGTPTPSIAASGSQPSSPSVQTVSRCGGIVAWISAIRASYISRTQSRSWNLPWKSPCQISLSITPHSAGCGCGRFVSGASSPACAASLTARIVFSTLAYQPSKSRTLSSTGTSGKASH